MKEHIDSAMLAIEEDYKVCLRIIGRYFDYLDTCGLKEFNKYSKYRWTLDRDKGNGYSYVCIRSGNSLLKKCLVKKRPYIEKDDLYKWVQNKKLIQEALEEAYQFIVNKVNTVKDEIGAIKEVAEDYEGKLGDISEDYEKAKMVSKKLGGEDFPEEESGHKIQHNRHGTDPQ